jgi:hypothetical protein
MIKWLSVPFICALISGCALLSPIRRDDVVGRYQALHGAEKEDLFIYGDGTYNLRFRVGERDGINIKSTWSFDGQDKDGPAIDLNNFRTGYIDSDDLDGKKFLGSDWVDPRIPYDWHGFVQRAADGVVQIVVSEDRGYYYEKIN